MVHPTRKASRSVKTVRRAKPAQARARPAAARRPARGSLRQTIAQAGRMGKAQASARKPARVAGPASRRPVRGAQGRARPSMHKRTSMHKR